ncbi:Triosephosphate isomerase [Candidatus Desulfarcum epimagneticum]|uniref:Triosephosphate isomerase n=1 Tax=uncultured Desulfobacteraceae bacterium TaxID=218296 RepID=A0A484HQG7_9BACT|nr:Triosephosphate isomerase [uncultured Desulfobacteraceae bacterium]
MTTRRPLIAGNWKMFKTSAEAVEAALRLAGHIASEKETDVMITPPFTALEAVAKAVSGTRLLLGAQNVHWENQGAYTGEISPLMLAAIGCRHVIIGHSERRLYFGETDETVQKKIGAAVDAGLFPVMCVGETGEERKSGKTFSTLDKQILNGLKGFVSDRAETLVIAYEPVWAIGTGETATPEQAQGVHAHLRGLIEKTFGKKIAGSIRILYGGSVKPANIKNLMDMPDIDGALVGGASLDPDIFAEIACYQSR